MEIFFFFFFIYIWSLLFLEVNFNLECGAVMCSDLACFIGFGCENESESRADCECERVLYKKRRKKIHVLFYLFIGVFICKCVCVCTLSAWLHMCDTCFFFFLFPVFMNSQLRVFWLKQQDCTSSVDYGFWYILIILFFYSWLITDFSKTSSLLFSLKYGEFLTVWHYSFSDFYEKYWFGSLHIVKKISCGFSLHYF